MSGRTQLERSFSGGSDAAEMAPRAHNISQRPRRQSDHASRPPPTIVRSHDPPPRNRLTREKESRKDTRPSRRPFEAKTARNHIRRRQRVGRRPVPTRLKFPDSDAPRFLPTNRLPRSQPRRHPSRQGYFARGPELHREGLQRFVDEGACCGERRHQNPNQPHQEHNDNANCGATSHGF